MLFSVVTSCPVHVVCLFVLARLPRSRRDNQDLAEISRRFCRDYRDLVRLPRSERYLNFLSEISKMSMEC